MAKKKLSDRQRSILEYIASYFQDNVRPPTIREIGTECKISSTSVVNYNLTRLVEQGFISRTPEKARGLQLTPKAMQMLGVPTSSNVMRVPLVGNIVAGSPIDLLDSDFSAYDDEDMIEVGFNMFKGDTDNLYALRVSGDSMIDAMVDDGDLVIMRQQTEARNGDMVAARITPDDTTTLKHYYHEPEYNRVRLQPANPFLDPIYVEPANVQVQGIVEMVIRQPSRARA